MLSSISPEELQRRVNGDDVPFMLDVREPEEMDDGVIPGSVNIPMGDVKERLGELPTDRDIVMLPSRPTQRLYYNAAQGARLRSCSESQWRSRRMASPTALTVS